MDQTEDQEICKKCGVKTDSLLWTPLGRDYEVCSNCYEIELEELEELEKRLCVACNRNTEIHPMDATICKTCEKEGWVCFYDFCQGKNYCYKK
ncbi:MAG: hypothetical protein Satyrvirus8_11 [Satyrvirus sp.]|uniref:Uncharacterized protein n=1 Tax=Satyrvirus sp. TaxID=2487771 RepID=A0A3G5AHA3_9VIRU|nr:MAG: hypothetical protein Satyrvirus8_11 [Satyrvirus sp.]